MKLLDEHHTKEIVFKYRHALKRLILLDYDGTLVGFTNLPSQAKPDDRLLKLLKQLISDEKNEVVIISGRDEKTLDAWMGHLGLMMIAEHGASIRSKNGEWEKEKNINSGWKDQIRPILQDFVTRCAGSLIEEKENTITWHYRNAKPDLGFTRSRELLNTLLQMISNMSLQVIDGNKILEVRQAGIDKGRASLKLLKSILPDFVLCIGDDTTDEDMFNALNKEGITIKVGNGPTAAQFNLPNQQEVFPLLEKIVGASIVKSQ